MDWGVGIAIVAMIALIGEKKYLNYHKNHYDTKKIELLEKTPSNDHISHKENGMEP